MTSAVKKGPKSAAAAAAAWSMSSDGSKIKAPLLYTNVVSLLGLLFSCLGGLH